MEFRIVPSLSRNNEEMRQMRESYMVKKIILYAKLAIERAIIAFFMVRNLFWPILNIRPRLLWRSRAYNLTEMQKRVLSDLNREGIAFTTLNELFGGDDVMAALSSYTSMLCGEKEAVGAEKQKPFLEYLLDAEPVWNEANPFMKIATDRSFLSIVNRYFCMCTKWYYLTVNVTRPVAAEAAAVSSQRWHRDPEDKKLCKVFIYLNDVSESSGPFVYLKHSVRGKKYGHLFPQRPPRGSYPADKALESMINGADVVTATGKAGTVIFCDTTGLHRGGYATLGDRVMATIGYRSKASPWRSHVKVSESRASGESDPVKRYALRQTPSRVGEFIIYRCLKPLFAKKTEM